MRLKKQKYWIDAVIKTPRILRWYSHWKSSLNSKRSPLNDELPWMTYEAIDWLLKNLNINMSIFEWGSGGSTLFFSRRVSQVVTVEHDPVWYSNVIKVLRVKSATNVLTSLVEPEVFHSSNEWYLSSGVEYTGYSFENYIKAIDNYPDASFDVIVVDGRARPGCMRHAISKLKLGGHLLLDNSERVMYQPGIRLVEKWGSIRFFGPGPYNDSPWETRIWHKDSL